MERDELREMIIDYMGKGFLDNIIDMFRHDTSLIEFIPSMIKSENLRVRIGTAALIEELKEEFREELKKIIPPLIDMLGDDNPENRGDAVYILGLLKDKEAIEHIKKLCNDPDPQVRDVVKETLLESGIGC